MVNSPRRAVDTRSLTDMLASPTLDTLVLINPHPKHRKLTEAPKERTHRTNRITPRTPPQPCTNHNYHEGHHRSNNERHRPSAHDRRHHTPVRTVWPQQSGKQLNVNDKAGDIQSQHRIPHPAALLTEVILLTQRLDLLTQRTPKPDYNVLEHPQRTHYRAVKPPEQPCKQKSTQHHRGIPKGKAPYQPRHSRQELNLGRPAPPVMAYAHEQQRNAHNTQRRKYYPDFP